MDGPVGRSSMGKYSESRGGTQEGAHLRGRVRVAGICGSLQVLPRFHMPLCADKAEGNGSQAARSEKRQQEERIRLRRTHRVAWPAAAGSVAGRA